MTNHPLRVVSVILGLIAVSAAALFILPRRPHENPSSLSPQRSSGDERHGPIGTQSLPTIATSALISADSPIAPEYEALDPGRDGWKSESAHERIEAWMKRLGTIVEQPTRLDLDQLAELVTSGFSCGSLLPDQLVAVYQADAISVMRQAETSADDDRKYRGVDGWTSAVRELLEPFGDANAVRFETKVFHVEVESDVAISRAYVVLSGQDERRAVQQNATWECKWRHATGTSLPLLESVTVSDYEQATARTEAGPPFVDCTLSVLGKNECFREQLLPGIDYWTSRIEQRLGMYIDGWAGLAVGDVNGDGLDDLYVCQPGGLPNRLFLQNSDGSATDVAARYGVDWSDRSTAALLADLDNDGRQDLMVAISGGVLFMQNGADGQFIRRQAVATGGQPYSLAAADFDDDGRLDLYVCCYNDGTRAVQQGGLGVPVPYYDANNGAPNVLLRNGGGFRFSDVTTEVGMNVNNRRFSYAAAWEDYDNDGDQDLYVANDFGRNNLYRNDGGRFTDVAAAAGVEDVGSGMSVAWSDYNQDGWMDIYVGNMFSAAGSRITFQRRFNPSLTDEALASLRRLARGNTLFENATDGTMRDVSFDAGVTMGRWAWSSNFVDVNNDGREDIVVANGFVTGTGADDL